VLAPLNRPNLENRLLINRRPVRPPHKPDHATVGKHATARIKILTFGKGSPTTMPPMVPPNRAHLIGLSTLSTKDSNPQAPNRTTSVDTVENQTCCDLSETCVHRRTERSFTSS
jgi:hypothetical protein